MALSIEARSALTSAAVASACDCVCSAMSFEMMPRVVQLLLAFGAELHVLRVRRVARELRFGLREQRVVAHQVRLRLRERRLERAPIEA